MSIPKKFTGGVVLLGAAALVSSPLAAPVRLRMRAWLAGAGRHHDPVAPFCGAPCYSRPQDNGAENVSEQRERLQ